MTVQQVLAELQKLGSESTKKTLMRHGAREPLFGVKIADLKKVQKRIKKDTALALKLFDTGNTDAMYLAGLVCDPREMKKTDLQKWARKAYWGMLADYTVAWIAAESRFGVELAREWIDSDTELIASCGWSTYSSIVAIKPDTELDLKELDQLLGRVEREIKTAASKVRYAMNGFVIAVGSFVAPLTARARSAARAIGTVEVDMGDTACTVPSALDYLDKVEKRGKIGAKRKTAFC